MTDDPAKPPRFPYIGAFFCVACLGAAACTWMRYSYKWDAMVRNLDQKLSGIGLGWPDTAYVRLRGDMEMVYVRVRGQDERRLRYDPRRQTYHVAKDAPRTSAYSLRRVVVVDAPIGPRPVDIVSAPEELPEAEKRIVVGRPVYEDAAFTHLDATASRFHPASIAGLVVGAMGVFVFSVALRHWLGERRRFRKRDEGA